VTEERPKLGDPATIRDRLARAVIGLRTEEQSDTPRMWRGKKIHELALRVDDLLEEYGRILEAEAEKARKRAEEQEVIRIHMEGVDARIRGYNSFLGARREMGRDPGPPPGNMDAMEARGWELGRHLYCGPVPTKINDVLEATDGGQKA
jgi:hypothetical protein